MSRAMKLILGAGAMGLLVVGALAWWLGLFSSEPEEASIESAIESVTADSDADDPTTTAAPTTAAPTTEAPTTTAAPTGGEGYASDSTTTVVDETTTSTTTTAPLPAAGEGITGGWEIEAGKDRYVGYRIKEVLSTVGDFTAVGRSETVSGSLVADGTTITSVDILANLSHLTSDSRARDGQMKSQALESGKFPDGIFTLTEPIELGEIPAEGVTTSFPAKGDLTIHGVTQPVELTIDAALVAGKIVIVGSTDILLTDYDIDPPRAPIVASVEDSAVMELSLVFARP